jgi:hypothetical protein
MTTCNCPDCGSENTSKISLIHEQGMTKSRGRGYIAGRFGVYSLNSQSEASKAFAPPKKGSPDLDLVFAITDVFTESWWVILIWLCILFGSSFFYILTRGTPIYEITCLLFLAYYARKVIIRLRQNIRTTRRNSDTYADRLNAWSNSYQCLRCAKVFEVT